MHMSCTVDAVSGALTRTGMKWRDVKNMLRRLYACVNAAGSHEQFLLQGGTFLHLLGN